MANSPRDVEMGSLHKQLPDECTHHHLRKNERRQKKEGRQKTRMLIKF